MRALLAVVAVLAAAPAAHAASATITSPAEGATFYTGAGANASVRLAATRDRSGCSAGETTTFNLVVRRATGENAGGANATSDSIDQTSLFGAGDYVAQANFQCFAPDQEIKSGTVSFHVVKGDPPEPTPTATATATPPPAETDGDGVPDADDDCDTADGPAWNRGCPPATPAAPKDKAERKARKAKSTRCTPRKLRREARAKAPAMDPGARVAKLRRCYARNVPGVPDGWPLMTFWSNARFTPAFDVFPPELRPENAPPIATVNLRARKGFNVYTVRKETSDRAVFLPVFSILTAIATPTNTGGRLQIGVIFPARGNPGYRRVDL